MWKSSSQSVNEFTVPEVTVLSVQPSSSQEKLLCNVTINPSTTQACTLELLVDTGSGVSILHENIYNQYFTSCMLVEPKASCFTYSKEKLNVLGWLSADATISEKFHFH